MTSKGQLQELVRTINHTAPTTIDTAAIPNKNDATGEGAGNDDSDGSANVTW